MVDCPKWSIDGIVRVADAIAKMGRGDECTLLSGKRYVVWELTDPAGRDTGSLKVFATTIEQGMPSHREE